MDLELRIDGIFYITGQGAVLSGTINRGKVEVGQSIVVATPGSEVTSQVLGIEIVASEELVSCASGQQNIAIQIPDLDFNLLADGVTKDDEGRPQPVDLVVRSVTRPWWKFW